MTIDRMRKPCPPFDHSGGLRYRPEIDGIRALTVIPVVLFTKKTPGSGGHLGVDVYFMILGF